MGKKKAPRDKQLREPQGSFIRWQATTIQQLTYSTNLILGLAVAALGFQINLLLDSAFEPQCYQKYVYLASLLTLLLSLIAGILCVINRLRDFRATARAARMLEQGKLDEDIEPHRTLYKFLGKRTWILFWGQIGAFGIGILLAILSLIPTLCAKLFSAPAGTI